MINEFRKDLVSGEWVLMSSVRAQRPHEGTHERLSDTHADCPFEPERMTDQEKPVLVSGDGRVVVIPNKFPALQKGVCGPVRTVGPVEVFDAVGYHELVITRDHDRHFAHFTTDETAEVLGVYRDRYRQMASDDCGAYISIFHNHGKAAGASIYHNHSQIISTPIIPPEVRRSLRGAQRYHDANGVGVHRALIDWEMKEGKRIVYENAQFIAFCPFVSKAGYEVRIFPKTQSPRFEESGDDSLHDCADALNAVLGKLYRALNDVDYNFYIHTVPVTDDPAINEDCYHWHLEIVPRIPIAAGFELSTAIYINPFDPDDCAKHLRDA